MPDTSSYHIIYIITILAVSVLPSDDLSSLIYLLRYSNSMSFSRRLS